LFSYERLLFKSFRYHLFESAIAKCTFFLGKHLILKSGELLRR